ncbi:MAG: recombinase family protein, partial [Planctomycetaceae bacterium]|nr:recombinase family protein [Planctomycetaceae bacterium]
MPPDDELARLFVAFVERQKKHWPDLAKLGLIPEPSAEVVLRMVDDFKSRHRGTLPDATALGQLRKHVKKLGGSYSRYSCDNSSPTSIVDQVVNILDKAKSEDRFIPWAYVFADYSVSGLTASRCGYTAYKRVLSDVSQLIDTTYVDDFTRASRSELEWWKLAALSKRHQKRLIGASDGFDLSNPNSEIMITMYGLLSRLFVKSLREKVSRGMKGAARRGTCLGKPALGFARRPKLDSDGRPLVGADGQSIHEFCIDPATAALRLRMYELYVSENLSCGKIARHFNEIRADGGDSWTQSSVRKLLLSPTAIGVFLWNRTRREYDAELERWVVLRNPSSQWARHFDPELAIVPLKLWRAARRKLAHARQASPLTGRPLSRN